MQALDLYHAPLNMSDMAGFMLMLVPLSSCTGPLNEHDKYAFFF